MSWLERRGTPWAGDMPSLQLALLFWWSLQGFSQSWRKVCSSLPVFKCSLSVDCGMRSLLVLFTLDGFKLKRSIVFASWTAGDFGNVGVTEWLEVCESMSSVLGNNCKQFVLKLSYGFVTCCFFCVKQGYWASLDRKAFTYISLDGVVTGKFTECKWSKFIIGFCKTNYKCFIYIYLY